MQELKGPKIVVEPPGPKSKEYMKLDDEFISRSYFRTYPTVWDEGKGVFLKDVDGNVFIDLCPGLGAGITGHCHPAIVEAIKKQVDKIIQPGGMDYYFTTMIEAARKLVEIAPGKSKKRVFFANSGAESNECAIKLARYHTKRKAMISFIGAFHGRTLGTLGLTTPGVAPRKGFGGFLSDTVHVPYAYCYRCRYKLEYPSCGLWCVHYIEEVIFTHVYSPDEVAAIIVEPIQGAYGVITPPDEFLVELSKICEKNGIMFIVDEVFTGFARTGKMFAVEHLNLEPDIMTTAKSIAGGLPLGACIAKSDVMDWTSGTHTSTFSGNGPVCAATIATINVIQKEKLAERAAKLEKIIKPRLTEMMEKSKIIGEIRGKGLFWGMEIVKDKKTKAYARDEAGKICQSAFKRGLIILRGGLSSVRFWPPAIISEEILEKALDIIESSIKEVEKGL